MLTIKYKTRHALDKACIELTGVVPSHAIDLISRRRSVLERAGVPCLYGYIKQLYCFTSARCQQRRSLCHCPISCKPNLLHPCTSWSSNNTTTKAFLQYQTPPNEPHATNRNFMSSTYPPVHLSTVFLTLQATRSPSTHEFFLHTNNPNLLNSAPFRMRSIRMLQCPRGDVTTDCDAKERCTSQPP